MSGPTAGDRKREFFPQLTSVRFFAALIVVLYHYNDEFSPYLPGFLKNLINHGYIGVSFFFILSGFILGANYYDRLLTRRVSVPEFLWARFSRIYPLYILSIISFLPRFLISPSKDPLPKEALYAVSHKAEVFFVSVFALQTLAFPSSAYLNSPTWSISTEIGFYLLLPLLIPLLAKVKRAWLVPSLFVLVLLAAVGPYMYHQQIFTVNLPKMGIEYTSNVNESMERFVRSNFLTRLPEFLAGVVAYRVYSEILTGSRRMLPVLGVIGGLLSVPFVLSLFMEQKSNMVYTILYTGQVIGIPFFLTVILGLVTVESPFWDWLKKPSWVLLGEASFALYLFHIPIKHFGQYVIGRVLHIPRENVLLSLVLIAFSVWFSIVLFKRVETPVRKKLTTWWKSRAKA